MIPKRPDEKEAASGVPARGLNKTSRSYIKATTKAVTHPVRSQILKALKEGDKPTVELENITGETRYNLYHHLNALEQVGLVGWTMRDNKTKLYRLQIPETPEVTVTTLTENEVKANKEKFKTLIETLGELAGGPILNVDKITGAEICLYYSWEDKQ
jgi:DNA-binding transcriptional ArsR family regulator